MVVHGIDTVDVSGLRTGLVGHSYYAGNESVISDLFYLLRGGMSPVDRFRLQPVSVGPLVYWRFMPGQEA